MYSSGDFGVFGGIAVRMVPSFEVCIDRLQYNEYDSTSSYQRVLVLRIKCGRFYFIMQKALGVVALSFPW